MRILKILKSKNFCCDKISSHLKYWKEFLSKYLSEVLSRRNFFVINVLQNGAEQRVQHT